MSRSILFTKWVGGGVLLLALCISALAGEGAAPKVRIILFTPADLDFPQGSEHRLTEAADACDQFYFHWMNHWGYPPPVKSLFVRNADHTVEVLQVHGEEKASSGKYAKPNFADYVEDLAAKEYHVEKAGTVWWMFIYLGDPPVRFQKFVGTGNPRTGGWAMVNYDSRPGEILPDLGLAEGFNGVFFLKGTIHELGHAFGLPHIGPDPSLGLGNALMGPQTAVYEKRNYPKPDQIYLPEACAAMLWKHPIFSGTTKDRDVTANIKLIDNMPVYDPTNDTITISGKVQIDQPAHSVVLIDDMAQENDYWTQSHSARIAPDGSFKLEIRNPVKASGHYRMLFCLDNGMVTGDGTHIRFVNRGDIKKSYEFSNGKFVFDDGQQDLCG